MNLKQLMLSSMKILPAVGERVCGFNTGNFIEKLEFQVHYVHPHSSFLRYSRTVGGSKELSYCSVNLSQVCNLKKSFSE